MIQMMFGRSVAVAFCRKFGIAMNSSAEKKAMPGLIGYDMRRGEVKEVGGNRAGRGRPRVPLYQTPQPDSLNQHRNHVWRVRRPAPFSLRLRREPSGSSTVGFQNLRQTGSNLPGRRGPNSPTVGESRR